MNRFIEHLRVHASPEEAWALIRNWDLNQAPLGHFLFDLKTLLPWIVECFRENKVKPEYTLRIDDFTGPDKSFQILSEAPGKEIVLGFKGQFFWGLRIDADSQGGSWITCEWAKPFLKEPSLRPRSLLKQFQEALGGAIDNESLRLPGDDIVTTPKYQQTLEISIETPPKNIWPWLVQMGHQRGGWYSIDLLDNGGKKSATRILPECQKIKVGDVLPWRPMRNNGFTVLSHRDYQSLVLGSTADCHLDSWAFILEPMGPKSTRLITRVRADFDLALHWRMTWVGIQWAHRLMGTVQLRNLKARAESLSFPHPLKV